MIIFICCEEGLRVQNRPWDLFFEFLCHFLIVGIGSGASGRLDRCLGALRRHLGDRIGALRLLVLLLICGLAAAFPILTPYFGQKKHDTDRKRDPFPNNDAKRGSSRVKSDEHFRVGHNDRHQPVLERRTMVGMTFLRLRVEECSP